MCLAFQLSVKLTVQTLMFMKSLTRSPTMARRDRSVKLTRGPQNLNGECFHELNVRARTSQILAAKHGARLGSKSRVSNWSKTIQDWSSDNELIR